MSRNFLFLRSVVFSLVTKASGFFVVFACLPLAALSLNVSDYSIFNYSMAVTGLFGILIAPISTALVARFAHVSDAENHRQMAEGTLAAFLTLGAILTPPAVCVAYFLSPAEHRFAISIAAAAVTLTNALSWADAYRVGLRQDHISSAFGLANNLTIISAVYLLYRDGSLSFANLLILYYGSPFFWYCLSLVQLMHSKAFRIRWDGQFATLRGVFRDAVPLFGQAVSDYVRLYGSSMIAFYTATTPSYAVFSTLMLFIARLTNPFSLIARPLIPAYVDAIKRSDRAWLSMMNRLIIAVLALAVLSVAIAGLAAVFVSSSEVHVGAIHMQADIIRRYLVLSVLMFWSSAISTILASLYLAQWRMGEFSNITLLANVLAVGIGALLTLKFDAVALFGSIAILNAVALGILTSRILYKEQPRRQPRDEG